jgi:exopolyphosphatase/guanosine-5'-triphosphate,3'-diphosphate pyrophosphatase
MGRVLQECDRAAAGFEPDPVHDLRVALRRCRSMADGLMAFDPDPGWKEMKKAGRELFRSLGELRDVQVMEEWAHKLDSPGDPVTNRLLEFFAQREAELKGKAAQALLEFDRKQWRRWTRALPRRAARFRQGSLLFKHLALERWTEAYALHRRALRSRSQAAFHRLRIGLKRFRYIVENFLPQQHAAWSNDLKELQDLLGEVHDLDVLWTTAQQRQVFFEAESRAAWHARIDGERNQRLQKYREKMSGPGGLWQVWRAELPQSKQVQAIAQQRIRIWASLLDPDFRHSSRVAVLALQLHDGITGNDGREAANERNVLRMAAWLHDVGRSKGEKNHHKASWRLICKLAPPLGIAASDLQLAAVVARYHRGNLPSARQKGMAGLSPPQRQLVTRLAALLRLANALDLNHDGRIQKLEVTVLKERVIVAAQGYNPRERMAEHVAAARHLLEVVCRKPVIVTARRGPAGRHRS